MQRFKNSRAHSFLTEQRVSFRIKQMVPPPRVTPGKLFPRDGTDEIPLKHPGTGHIPKCVLNDPYEPQNVHPSRLDLSQSDLRTKQIDMCFWEVQFCSAPSSLSLLLQFNNACRSNVAMIFFEIARNVCLVVLNPDSSGVKRGLRSQIRD